MIHPELPLLEEFISYLQFEKRYSLHTIDSYRSDLEFFFEYLQLQYTLTDPVEVRPTMIRSWLASLKEKGDSARSINRRISTLKSFFKYQLKNQRIGVSPMTTIVSPKVKKRLPVYVEQADMNTLFQYVEFPEGWDGVLHRMILVFFYATGMRLSELTSLKDRQVDLALRLVKILGKGNKERVVPLSPELKERIEQYRLARGEIFGTEHTEYFFLNSKGRPLSPRAVQILIKKYLSLATTIEKKSPHVLRHTFATHLMNNGAELNAVKELLGHSSLAATQIYTHNTIEKLKDVYRKAHPKA